LKGRERKREFEGKEEFMKQIIITITTIAIVIITIMAYNTAQQAIRIQAIDGCLHAGTASFKNAAGVDVQTPDDYSYNLCMQRKGIK